MGYKVPCKWTYTWSRRIAPRGICTNLEQRRWHTSTTLYHWTSDMHEQTMKHGVGKRSKAVPWKNDGEQFDPNARRTLIHVGPTANVLPWLMSLILPANTRILCHWYSSQRWPTLRFLHSWYVGRHWLGQGSPVHSTGHPVSYGMTLRPSGLYGSILLD